MSADDLTTDKLTPGFGLLCASDHTAQEARVVLSRTDDYIIVLLVVPDDVQPTMTVTRAHSVVWYDLNVSDEFKHCVSLEPT